jgi:glycolate oxidase FAD binding subunit
MPRLEYAGRAASFWWMQMTPDRTPSGPDALLAGFRAVVGEAHARAAGAGDAVDGMWPAVVVEPASVAELSECLKLAHARRLGVAPRGSGSKLGWGAPPRRLDVVLATTRLDRLVDHAAGDLVVTAQAGVRLAALQARLAEAGQWLALDPPEAGATLGGVVAAGASGPRRHRYGAPRDVLIGIRVVLADGSVAKAGGRVVKNVAGYDLGKLFAGSFGTLGVLAEASFRLHPLPAERRLVRLELGDFEAAGAAVQGLLQSSLEPSAVELLWERPERGWLAVLFEGAGRSVVVQASAATSRLERQGTARTLEADALQAAWAEHRALPYGPGDLGIRIGALPADLPLVLAAVAKAGRERSLVARIAGRAGVASLHVGWAGGDDAARADAVVALRDELGPRGASVIVTQASPELKRRLDVWGPLGAAELALMRRVKERFDPEGILSPGRFVGGL